MNYSYIEKCNLSCGNGVRVVLWVSGCPLHCKGCQNEWLQNPEAGKPFTEESYKELYDLLNHDYITGLTFCGGSPLADYNREGVAMVAKRVKEDFPNKDIWCYTGYTYGTVKDFEALKYIDVLLDGPFQEDKKDPELKYVGSSNQRVIDVKKTRQTGNVSLLYFN